MKRINTLAATAIIATIACLQAKSEVHSTTPTNQNIDFIMGDTLDKSSGQIYNTLIGNAPASPGNRDLPKFTIIGKENKFYMSIGAQFKSTMNFDWGNPLSTPSLFIPSNIHHAQPGNREKLDFTVQRSRISFNFVGLPNTDNQLGVYFALMFNGNGNEYGVKINQAYVKYYGFKIGYTSALFCDQTAIPYTIDAQSVNSSATFSNTVINYQHEFKNNIKIGVGLERPFNYITTNDYTTSVSNRIPDIPMYIQYSWDKNSHIRLSSIFRNIAYRDKVADKNRNNFGWGLKLSGTSKIDNFTLYYMAKYGNGMASYIQDNWKQDIDMVPSPNENGKLKMSESWGAFGAVQYNFSPNLFCTAIYSQIRNYIDPYEGGNIKYSDQYKYGQYVGGNIIWSPNKYIQTGLEYLWGNRANFDGSKHSDNRLQALFMVSF